MSDLINRSELLKRLEEWNTSDKTDKALYNFALHRIIEQPTAYSVEKVVDELEEIKGSACGGKSCSECEYASDCLEGEQSEKVVIDKAIEIVKQGGVDDDVCEWKYNDSEYYFESSCEHLHIFMSDGPKENEYDFCPYCGKKIKVVE